MQGHLTPWPPSPPSQTILILLCPPAWSLLPSLGPRILKPVPQPRTQKTLCKTHVDLVLSWSTLNHRCRAPESIPSHRLLLPGVSRAPSRWPPDTCCPCLLAWCHLLVPLFQHGQGLLKHGELLYSARYTPMSRDLAMALETRGGENAGRSLCSECVPCSKQSPAWASPGSRGG